MKKLTFIFISMIACFTQVNAQHQTIVFDAEKNYFNQGQALPAETAMMLTGEIHNEADLIEVLIFKDNSFENILYKNYWQRQTSSAQYQIPINYKLRGDKSYNWKINAYTFDETKKSVIKKSEQAISDYINNTLLVNDQLKLKIGKKQEKVIHEDIRNIVVKRLADYKNVKMQSFEEFSPLIQAKINQLVNGNISLEDKIGNVAIVTDETETEKKRVVKSKQAKAENESQLRQQVNSLLEIIRKEVSYFYEGGIYSLVKSQSITDYPVSQTNNTIALNVGYGGVYLSGDAEDFSTVSSPYIGLSVPLSSSSLAPNIIQNTSLSAGLFIKNMETLEGYELTGPFIDRPFYGAIGYKILPFIQLNVGGSILQQNMLDDRGDVINSEVFLKPFVGFSAQFNLSLGINR